MAVEDVFVSLAFRVVGVNRHMLLPLHPPLVVAVLVVVMVVVVVVVVVMVAVVEVVVVIEIVVAVVDVVVVGACTILVTGPRALLVLFWINLNVSKLPSEVFNQVAQFTHHLLNQPQVSHRC